MKNQKEQNNLLFENHLISVRQFTIHPGDSILLHSGRKRILFAHTSAHLKILEPPVAKDLIMDQESVCWHDHSDFTIHNTDMHSSELVIFSLKEGRGKNYLKEHQKDLADPFENMDFQVQLDNPDVKVLKGRLKPREHLPTPPGDHVVLFALSPYTIRYFHERLGEINKTVKVGDVLFHGPEVPFVENLGQNTLAFLVLVLKSPSFESVKH